MLFGNVNWFLAMTEESRGSTTTLYDVFQERMRGLDQTTRVKPTSQQEMCQSSPEGGVDDADQVWPRPA